MRKLNKFNIDVLQDDTVRKWLVDGYGVILNQDEKGNWVPDNKRSKRSGLSYLGDLKKFQLFMVEKEKEYQSLTEFLNLVHKKAREDMQRMNPSDKEFFGESEINEYIRWLESYGQAPNTVSYTHLRAHET